MINFKKDILLCAGWGHYDMCLPRAHKMIRRPWEYDWGLATRIWDKDQGSGLKIKIGHCDGRVELGIRILYWNMDWG